MNIKSTAVLSGALLLAACASTSVQDQDKPKAERAKVAANMQEVKLTSNPESASCVVMKDDEKLASLDATPGFVTIKRSNFKSVDVTCSKDGYETTTAKLRTIAMDKSIDGNIGAAISLFKMAQGSISSYEDSLFIKLDPAYFASEEARLTYIEDEVDLLELQRMEAIDALGKCKKKKCKKKKMALNESYDTRVSSVKTMATSKPIK